MTVDLTVIFALLGFTRVKALHKMLVKSTPGDYDAAKPFEYATHVCLGTLILKCITDVAIVVMLNNEL